jgi:hypothetical protein
LKHLIYGLYDPRNEIVRYVGYTSKTPEHRLKKHISEINCKRSSHYRKSRWIKKLLGESVFPNYIILEVLDDETCWKEAEKRWIAYYTDAGNDLCNHTKGGDGVVGYRWPEELRERMRAIFRDRKPASIETREKMRSNMLGRMQSQETIAKRRQKVLGQKRKPHTQETRDKMSLTRTEKTLSQETKNKLSKANKGKKPPASVIDAVIESNKNRKWTKEQRNHLSEKRKQMWADPVMRQKNYRKPQTKRIKKSPLIGAFS